jgi:hypothetical protein
MMSSEASVASTGFMEFHLPPSQCSQSFWDDAASILSCVKVEEPIPDSLTPKILRLFW